MFSIAMLDYGKSTPSFKGSIWFFPKQNPCRISSLPVTLVFEFSGHLSQGPDPARNSVVSRVHHFRATIPKWELSPADPKCIAQIVVNIGIVLQSYGGFLKYGYPQSSSILNHFNGIVPYRPSSYGGTPHRKPPYLYILNPGFESSQWGHPTGFNCHGLNSFSANVCNCMRIKMERYCMNYDS